MMGPASGRRIRNDAADRRTRWSCHPARGSSSVFGPRPHRVHSPRPPTPNHCANNTEPSHRMNIPDIADAVLEAPIVTSFTKIGYHARRSSTTGRRSTTTTYRPGHRAHRRDVGARQVRGRRSSLADGATLVLVGRSVERNQEAVDEIAGATGNRTSHQVACDMGDLDQVRATRRAGALRARPARRADPQRRRARPPSGTTLRTAPSRPSPARSSARSC